MVRNVVHQLMGYGLGAGSLGESGDELRAGITGYPEPGNFHCPVQLQAQFVELDVRQR